MARSTWRADSVSGASAVLVAIAQRERCWASSSTRVRFEFLTLPIRNLHSVPASIPTEHAVFIEPIAAACEILDQVKIPKGERVAVLGDGKLGLLVSQVLQAKGARVHLFGRHRR